MNILLGMIWGLVVIVFFSIVMAIVFSRLSYRNMARIARQTGQSPDDVIWLEDRFKVLNRDGFWIIKFKKLRERTSSVPGSFWTKFVNPGHKEKVLKFDDDEWKSRDISRMIRRGITFYETNEGEFHPMVIKTENGVSSLHIISQDNRQFLINEIKDINSLTKNRFKEMLLLGGIIVACFILAIIFILGIIYMKESAQSSLSSSQQACIDYYRVVQNISSTASQNGGAQFLDQATGILMQGGG